ncbi:hypothetical protein OIU85_020302 [Salix viminalis]|uniref:Uncharacterized protein n=1 Tax=Salix viminalis TaxID=40686 RepID=A0A9Q0UG68_SALVM|nr:hypothetical protein OIU85_020302 [Salix viminalis]
MGLLFFSSALAVSANPEIFSGSLKWVSTKTELFKAVEEEFIVKSLKVCTLSGFKLATREVLLSSKIVFWRIEGVDLDTQMVKNTRKNKEEIAKENTMDLVDLKEKLLCLSISEK